MKRLSPRLGCVLVLGAATVALAAAGADRRLVGCMLAGAVGALAATWRGSTSMLVLAQLALGGGLVALLPALEPELDRPLAIVLSGSLGGVWGALWVGRAATRKDEEH